ncbi:MAG: DNA mismatch repair endonuclease MutL [Eubacteriales bacterium]|nr:DNA mismatch repair endonuclease MutL [Eubacteriales bacterium]
MAVIHELDSHMADLIAAGEVVERPASVCKELVENAIDAGATQITVELEHGGISYLRMCDNGCGMSPEDAPIAFRRHATSKIRTKEDLSAIGTLGFRGEALAAISAVAHVELFTKQSGCVEGTHLALKGGKIIANEPAGCPEGTTFVIRDLFYNTPARMKFLKKDFTEAGYITSVVEHAAESHPEIAFRCIRDGKDVFHSPGNGNLKHAVFSVFGKDLSQNLIDVPEHTLHGIKVWGYISKPHAPRSNRTYQHFFVNGRFIKSKLIQAAMEEAYRNSIITGKFPYGCICIELPLSAVDVNVHPAKTEVKFSQEKQVFSAVYAACKNALAGDDNIPEIQAKEDKKQAPALEQEAPSQYTVSRSAIRMTPRQEEASVRASHAPAVPVAPLETSVSEKTSGSLHTPSAYRSAVAGDIAPKRRGFMPFVDVDDQDAQALRMPQDDGTEETLIPSLADAPFAAKKPEPQTDAVPGLHEQPEERADVSDTLVPDMPKARVIGSCFDTYILAEDPDGLILIDKHAAHERILFNQLRKQADIPTQMLLQPVVVDLSGEEYAAVMDGIEQIQSLGFALEPFGQHSIAVREIPAYIDAGDLSMVLSEMAEKLMDRRTPEPDCLDDLIHTVSCKAAIKGGWKTSMQELQSLCDRVLADPEVTCCPHGRPVTVRLTKYELDKMFKRVNQ